MAGGSQAGTHGLSEGLHLYSFVLFPKEGNTRHTLGYLYATHPLELPRAQYSSEWTRVPQARGLWPQAHWCPGLKISLGVCKVDSQK